MPVIRSKAYAAAAALARPVAIVPSVRRVAYAEDASGGIGFDGLVPVATTSAGTTLLADSPGGLTGFTLNAASVQVPTSRGIGFIVDTNLVKQFVLQWELESGGTSGGRLFVRPFDASWNVMDNSGGDLVFADRGALAYTSGARWWAQGSDAADASFGRRQVVSVASTVKAIQIGVFGGSAAINLMSLSLSVPGLRIPPLLHGLSGLNWAGVREFATVKTGVNVPSLAAGANYIESVTLTRAQRGDEAFAGLTQSIAGITESADVQGANTVQVSYYNGTGGTLDPASGDLRCGVRKVWL